MNVGCWTKPCAFGFLCHRVVNGFRVCCAHVSGRIRSPHSAFGATESLKRTKQERDGDNSRVSLREEQEREHAQDKEPEQGSDRP